MAITSIKIKLINKEDLKLKAVASIVVDNFFIIHDIKILKGQNGIFIAMPSKKIPSGDYKDIVHPIDAESREHLSKLLFEAYEKELLRESLQENPQE